MEVILATPKKEKWPGPHEMPPKLPRKVREGIADPGNNLLNFYVSGVVTRKLQYSMFIQKGCKDKLNHDTCFGLSKKTQKARWKWAESWQINFNIRKCEMLHLRIRSNINPRAHCQKNKEWELLKCHWIVKCHWSWHNYVVHCRKALRRHLTLHNFSLVPIISFADGTCSYTSILYLLWKYFHGEINHVFSHTWHLKSPPEFTFMCFQRQDRIEQSLNIDWYQSLQSLMVKCKSIFVIDYH